MKIDKKIINGSTLSIVCSGKFGIGSKGNPSAQLIRNEIKSFLDDKDLKITHIKIDFSQVKYEWGDGPLSAIMPFMNSDLQVILLASQENSKPLHTLFEQSGISDLFTIRIETA